MVKPALVTGATGFIGRRVLSPLADRGFEVHVMNDRDEIRETCGGMGLSRPLVNMNLDAS